MEKVKSFKSLILTTCIKIIVELIFGIVLLYIFPLLMTSVEIKNNNRILSKERASIFLNVFSWIYICIILIIIVSINFYKLLKKIKNEMEIVYCNGVCIDKNNSKNKSNLNIKEFCEIKKQIDTMNYKINEMIEKEKQQKEDLIFKVSAASHDLLTPLTVLHGNIELLLEEKNINENNKYIKDIKAASFQLKNYFNELINYSKTFYEDESQFKEYKFSDIFEIISQELSYIIKEKDNLKITNKVIANISINLNLGFLIRAIENIIKNAIEYGKKDNCKIEIKFEINRELLIIKIWNNGPCFSKAIIENSDKLFYREDKTRLGDSGHFGIGLAFVNRVAKLHNGKLELVNLENGVEVNLSLGLKKENSYKIKSNT